MAAAASDTSAPPACGLSVRGGADAADAAAAANAELVLYPPMTDEEITEKLNTIPVFGLTDKKGNAVVVQTEDGEQVNWCFLQQELAHALLKAFTEQQKQADPATGVADPDNLMVRDVPLGMVWKALIMPPAEVSE